MKPVKIDCTSLLGESSLMISGFSVISPSRVWSSQIGLRKRRKCANDVRRYVKMFAFLQTNSHVSGFFSDIQFLAAIPELLL